MSESPESAGFTPPVILVVDDDDVVRAIMRAELEDEGYQVIEAEDGMAALAACRDSAPDLMVIDVVMPRMDGYELTQELRRDPLTAFTPILMATGLDDEASIAKAYIVGATDFIPKPIVWTILRQRVRYMLRSAEAFRSLRDNEAKLIAAKDAAEAGNRAKSEFLAVMSHELRTPLNAVIGLSSVMQGQTLGALSPKYLELIGMVLDSGRHLLGMIEDVLDLARAESDELTLTPRPVDLSALVNEVDARMRKDAEKDQVALSSTVEPGLPRMMADPDRFERILTSLVSNAIKFNTKGGRASLDLSRDAAGNLCIRVEDTGIGMSREKIVQALAPFGQADGGLTRQYGGAGVGLPLSLRLAELHGGRLAIESQEGKGTVATVVFPSGLFVDGAPASVNAA